MNSPCGSCGALPPGSIPNRSLTTCASRPSSASSSSTAGTVRFQGRDITGLAPRRITRLGICRSFQIPQVFDTLTAYENLLVGLGIVKLGRKAFAVNASDLAAMGDSAGTANGFIAVIGTNTDYVRGSGFVRRLASYCFKRSYSSPGTITGLIFKPCCCACRYSMTRRCEPYCLVAWPSCSHDMLPRDER